MFVNHSVRLVFLSIGIALFCSSVFSCSGGQSASSAEEADSLAQRRDSLSEYGAEVRLPVPFEAESQNKFAKVIGWPEGKTPVAPAGYKVLSFAKDLNSPRNIYVAPDGRIFVAQARTERPNEDPDKAGARNMTAGASPNSVLLFSDSDGDGIADASSVFLEGLKQPFGMLVHGAYFYVANTDGVWRYPYEGTETKIVAKGQKIMELPAGGYNNHWTRNLLLSADSSKIYVSVGSGSNVAENGIDNERRRANILQVSLDGNDEKIVASGLRNPVGMALEPVSKELWTAVNERDEMGDEMVPDYLTSVREGGFYGWPYAYWGKHPDPRLEGKREDLVSQSIVPDFALGSHTASLGLAFSRLDKFEKGAYVGQHGSWNRSEFIGYKVLFIPFEEGNPTGEHRDFLTGFIADPDSNEVYGRPVAVAFSKQGYMLVSDDAANCIWTVLPQ